MTKGTFRCGLVAALIAVVLFAVPAALARPTATLTLASESVAAWTSFNASGCGYAVDKPVNVGVDSPYWNAGFAVPVDADGCIAFTFWVDGPGSYTVRAYQSLKNSDHLKLLASADLVVV